VRPRPPPGDLGTPGLGTPQAVPRRRSREGREGVHPQAAADPLPLGGRRGHFGLRLGRESLPGPGLRVLGKPECAPPISTIDSLEVCAAEFAVTPALHCPCRDA